MLSWKSNKGLIFNKNNFKIIDEIEYNTEGWGLSTYKDNLVMSDGSEKVRDMIKVLELIIHTHLMIIKGS